MTDKTSAPARIDAEAVAAYLEANPEFFVGRDELLGELHVPHETGAAVSLVER